MSDLAIDRFALSPDLEERAEEIAGYLPNDADLLLGFLQSSIAISLERPRWQSRDRLAVDLRAIQLALKKPRRHPFIEAMREHHRVTLAAPSPAGNVAASPARSRQRGAPRTTSAGSRTGAPTYPRRAPQGNESAGALRLSDD
jgi:hypothetical protein